ncbi:MAG: dihydroxyacetone kinase subunit DhaL [Chloroflexi bacterium]|nr:dihydroxyacetone kinase subunit DhaL [Chloroflexota bacterium]MCY4247804.1 dihydroxyacetone kinase subunit DhaL [Chloroflexota bacterium]
MTADELADLIERMAERVLAEREALNRLDAAIGDGDHGSSISGALALAMQEINMLEEPSLHAIWLTTAKALLNGMGGASGAIFGTFFLKGAAQLKDVERISQADMTELLQAGLAGVQARGRATVGDKTMVDALAPAVAAFAAAVDFPSAWRAAAGAAATGAESTRDMLARQGRAKYLGERALGHVDPGASAIALMFAAAADAYAQ